MHHGKSGHREYGLLKKNEWITIDVVGDSVTNGLDYCTADETYPAQLAALISKKLPQVSVYRYDGIVKSALLPMKGFAGLYTVGIGTENKRIDVIRNGIGGNTVRRAIRRLNDFTGILANGRKADLTVFMFGINDSLEADREKYVTPERFADDYRELLKKFKETEASEIVIMSATSSNYDMSEYAQMTKLVAQQENILYVDQFKVWKEHYCENAPNFGQGDWLGNDPYHPTKKGAAIIAETLLEHIL
jgi:lysophospholipase L1-like esterase